MLGVALACGLTPCVERLVRVGARRESRLGLGSGLGVRVTIQPAKKEIWSRKSPWLGLGVGLGLTLTLILTLTLTLTLALTRTLILTLTLTLTLTLPGGVRRAHGQPEAFIPGQGNPSPDR